MSAHSSVDRRKPLDVDSTQRMRALTPDRALRLPSTEVLCRTARGLGPAGESGHDAAPRSLRGAPALYDCGETGERHVARAAVGILPGRRIGAGYLRISADVLLVAVDRARQHRRADTFRTAERFPSTCLAVGADACAGSRTSSTDAKSDGCHRACEGANENESPAEPGAKATQDARRRTARRSARAAAFPQRPEPCSGAKRLVAHSSVRRSEAAPALDLIVSTGRAAA